MLKRVLGLLCLLAVALPSLARAETIDIERAGPWSAFTGRANDGRRLCGMSTSWDNGQFFGVKRFGADRYLVIQAINPSWRFNGANVRVRMQMDNYDAWTASAATQPGGTKLEFTVPVNAIEQFVREFYESGRMRLEMGANHVTWNVDLTGTGRVTSAFSKCLRTM